MRLHLFSPADPSPDLAEPPQGGAAQAATDTGSAGGTLRAPPGHDNAALQRRMRAGRWKDRAVGSSPCALEEAEHNLGLVFQLSAAVCMVLADHAGIPFVPGEEARA